VNNVYPVATYDSQCDNQCDSSCTSSNCTYCGDTTGQYGSAYTISKII